ncbi:MAG: helix-turn-helix domain-containing protein [Cyanobacteria bacterium P01_H01_bin.58]
MPSFQLISKHDPNWLAPGSPNDPRLLHSAPDDKVLLYPNNQGYRQEIVLQEELSIFIIDYTLQRDVLIEDRGGSNWLKFEFPLTGPEVDISFWSSRLGKGDFSVVPKRRHIFELEVLLKRSLLEQYFQAIAERLPEQVLPMARNVLDYLYSGVNGHNSGLTLAELLERFLARPFTAYPSGVFEPPLFNTIHSDAAALFRYRFQRRTPAMEHVIAQILSCPYQGGTRRRYLKRQALKLVSLHLEAMCQPLLPQADLDSIYEAAAILRQQMINPPAMEQLAREVYTNRLKLYQGFHAVFRTTPVGYLRRHRMEQARYLLRTYEWSVSQVAAAVGYSSRNRFATAFRQTVGLNPKALQLHAQRDAS